MTTEDWVRYQRWRGKPAPSISPRADVMDTGETVQTAPTGFRNESPAQRAAERLKRRGFEIVGDVP